MLGVTGPTGPITFLVSVKAWGYYKMVLQIRMGLLKLLFDDEGIPEISVGSANYYLEMLKSNSPKLSH